MKKYELLIDDTIDVFGVTLFRIKALISFGNVAKGDLGGYVEKEGNLSHSGDAWVSGNARVSGDALVYGDALVSGDADYIVFKNHWSSGRYFTYTKSNKMWKVGCFYGTGQELIEKAYRDSEVSGKHYEAYVEFVEKLEEITNEKHN
nr:MAG TPA: Putative transferase, nesg, ydcK, Structural Genomics.38A [Caudoviricetes sp.]